MKVDNLVKAELNIFSTLALVWLFGVGFFAGILLIAIALTIIGVEYNKVYFNALVELVVGLSTLSALTGWLIHMAIGIPLKALEYFLS